MYVYFTVTECVQCSMTAAVRVCWMCLFLLTGLQYIKQLCVPEFNSVEMEVGTK